MKISGLYRYPVKGLSGELLKSAILKAGAYFPYDRLYAIANGSSGFDPEAPAHQPKIKFLMLMRNERLAKLATSFDEVTNILTISVNAKQVARGDISTPLGRLIIEQFFLAFCADDLRGVPKILEAPADFRFTDSRQGFISLINLASVRDVARVAGKDLDPIRFRGNITLEGLDAWAEHDLVGQTIQSGEVKLEILKRIERCAATNVNPQTAARDVNLPKTLLSAFGHTDCGIYARVIAGGELKLNAEFTL